MFEATSYACECEISRETIFSYLNVLEETLIVSLIKPFSKRRANEIISVPKVFAFDSGFVKQFKKIDNLRSEDKGFFWELLVLNELFSVLQHRRINYWRDKQGHEIDFILNTYNKKIAIECKWKEKYFDPQNFKIFSKYYPEFEKVAICSDVSIIHQKKIEDMNIKFLNISHLVQFLQ